MAKKKQVGRRVEGWKAKELVQGIHPRQPREGVYRRHHCKRSRDGQGQDHAVHPRRDHQRLRKAAHQDELQDCRSHRRRGIHRVRRPRSDPRLPAVPCQAPQTPAWTATRWLSQKTTRKSGSRSAATPLHGQTSHRSTRSGTRSSQALQPRQQAWDLTTLVNAIVSGELSRDLFKVVKTLYPTRRVEVIKSKVEQVAAPISTK